LRLDPEDGDRKRMQRTPALAEGLTDHIWSLSEFLCSEFPFSETISRPRIPQIAFSWDSYPANIG
jgi:hypothetical protein